MQELADEALIALIRRRDQQAYACFLRRHLDGVHRYLLRLTGSRADSEELSQEVFLRVWQKAHTFKARQGKPTTWLYRIAHNLCVDLFRKRGGAAESELPAELPDPSASAEQQLTSDRAWHHFQQVLEQLPHTQRAALMLCQVQGFSNKEAAQILGVGVRAIESLLARARRTLRETLQDAPTDGAGVPHEY